MAFLLSGVVGEQIKLFTRSRFGRIRFRNDVVCHQIHTPNEQIGVDNPVKQSRCRVHNFSSRGSEFPEILRAVRGLWQRASVAVGLGLAVEVDAPCGVVQIVNIVPDGQHDLVGDKALAHQIEHQLIRHLADNQTRFVRHIRTREHLSGADAVGARLVGFDVRDCTRLPSPRMIDEQFCVFAEQFVQQILVFLRAQRDIAHGAHAVLLEFFRGAASHAPEVGERLVRPQFVPEFALVQLGDTHAIPVGRNVLGNNIHRHLAQKQVGADAGRGRDAGGVQHIEDDFPRQLTRGQTVGLQIAGHVHEHLVDGVHHHVLRRDIFHVNGINPAAVRHIMCHMRRCDDEIHRKRRVYPQFRSRVRRAGEHMSGCTALPLGVDLLDALAHLKQPSAAGNAVAFERWRHRQTDGLVRAGLVRHHKVRVERIEVALLALYGGIEGFQVDGKVGVRLHGYASFRAVIHYILPFL